MFTDENREFGEGVDFLENILHNSTVFAETSSEVVIQGSGLRRRVGNATKSVRF